MQKQIKKITQLFIPAPIRSFVSRSIPRFYKLNTYLLKRNELIKKLSPINKKYYIREVGLEDIEKLRKVESYRNAKSFEKKILPRLNSTDWHGLAVFDKNTGDIAYVSWVIDSSIPYFEEFGIKLKVNQFLLKDGFCVPDYRHQGLHTRMEQERINYCIRYGGNEMFIQIHDSNKKGIYSVINNGYAFFQQDYVIFWFVFNIYRSLKGFLKNPFAKVIK